MTAQSLLAKDLQQGKAVGQAQDLRRVRMFKKLMLLATALAALCVFGAASASASWFHQGVALQSGQDRTIHLTGTTNFASSSGGVHCANTTMNITATGGTTTGHATYSVSSPTTCEISGGLTLLCGGTTRLETVNLTAGATVHILAGTDRLSVTNITMHLACANGFGFDMTSEVAPLSIENIEFADAIEEVTLTGKLKTNLPSGVFGILAHLGVTPGDAGTYGITSS